MFLEPRIKKRVFCELHRNFATPMKVVDRTFSMFNLQSSSFCQQSWVLGVLIDRLMDAKNPFTVLVVVKPASGYFNIIVFVLCRYANVVLLDV